MYVEQFLQNRQVEFNRLCQAHRVHRLFAFGSSTRSDFDVQNSDIDLLVQLDEEDPLERGDLLMALWDKMESFFDRKVDLLTDDSIRNVVLKNVVNRDKKLIYDRKGA